MVNGRKRNICAHLAPDGWKEKHKITEKSQQEVVVEETPAIGTKQQKSAWASFPVETGLIKKVYGVDPLICPKCGSVMRIIAFILDPAETEKIIKHLIKIGRAPPDVSKAS